MEALDIVEKNFVRERFLEHTIQGATPSKAIYYAIIDAGFRLLERSKSDPHIIEDILEQIQNRISLPMADELRFHLTQELRRSTEYTKRTKLPPGPFIFGYIVTTGGGVQDIPDPACVEAHLPRDRKPTKEDIIKAWEACKT
jgi:hypothetical protein